MHCKCLVMCCAPAYSTLPLCVLQHTHMTSLPLHGKSSLLIMKVEAFCQNWSPASMFQSCSTTDSIIIVLHVVCVWEALGVAKFFMVPVGERLAAIRINTQLLTLLPFAWICIHRITPFH